MKKRKIRSSFGWPGRRLENILRIFSDHISTIKVFEYLSRKQFTHASFFNDEILPETANYEDRTQPKTPFHQRTLFKVGLGYIKGGLQTIQANFFKSLFKWF